MLWTFMRSPGAAGLWEPEDDAGGSLEEECACGGVLCMHGAGVGTGGTVRRRWRCPARYREACPRRQPGFQAGLYLPDLVLLQGREFALQADARDLCIASEVCVQVRSGHGARTGLSACVAGCRTCIQHLLQQYGYRRPVCRLCLPEGGTAAIRQWPVAGFRMGLRPFCRLEVFRCLG